MKRQSIVKGLLLGLTAVLLLAMASSAAAVFTYTIDMSANPGTEILVDETVTITAVWTTNKDVTNYAWYVCPEGVDPLSTTPVDSGTIPDGERQAGTHTFDFTPAEAGTYVVWFHIWHFNPNQSDRDAWSSITITVTEAAYEGLSHGFWKNTTEDWPPTGYSPSQTLASVFTESSSFGLGSYTLLQALDFTGGNTLTEKAQILLRNAVAAVLNAAHPGINYPLTVAQVIAQVNAALASGDADTMLELETTLDGYNNLGGEI